ncbi:MAG TPA: LPS export ABC transporter periplasmic protein LptC [Methylovirgula sp.]|nr:LPS export ABC transporter periplasmic protein LptC [Methylovirgula sp.]
MTDLTRAPEFSGGRLDLPVGRSPRAIRIARLHSIFVRYLRHFIIVGCSLGVLALGILILFDPFKRLPRTLSVDQVGLQGSVVTLKTPKMKGFRQDGQPFELTGLSGTQDILNPSVINLVGVDAKVGLDDATTAKITARRGIYDSSQDIVWLRDDVRIKNDVSGYDMRMRSATVDLQSSALLTEEPVLVIMNDGSTISADRMDITDNGHKISFQGEVKSVVDSGGMDAETAASSEEASK